MGNEKKKQQRAKKNRVERSSGGDQTNVISKELPRKETSKKKPRCIKKGDRSREVAPHLRRRE